MPSCFKSTFAVALVLGVWSAPARAQERSANNAIFIEGLGPGLVYSLNYERLFGDIGFRIGAGYVSVTARSTTGPEAVIASLVTVPVTLDYLGISSGSHTLELDAGVTFIRAGGSVSDLALTTTAEGMLVLGTAGVGYRFAPRDGGFLFRLGLDALFGKGLDLSSDNSDPQAMGVVPWGHLSLGVTF